MEAHYPEYWRLLSQPAYALPPNESRQLPEPQQNDSGNIKQGPPFFHRMTFVRHPVYWAASYMGEQLCAFKIRKMFDSKCHFNLTDYYWRRYLEAELERCSASSNDNKKAARCLKQAEEKAELCSDTDVLLPSNTRLPIHTSEFHKVCSAVRMGCFVDASGWIGGMHQESGNGRQLFGTLGEGGPAG